METLQTRIKSQKLHEHIEKVLKAFKRDISQEKKGHLERYFLELSRWNEKINLTGIRDIEKLVLKHLGDTLLFEKYLPKNLSSLLDIGTGAGVPGLLLKILRPELEVFLAEAVKKKCSFLEFIIATLGLKDIHVINKRINGKGFSKMPPKGLDVITSQATGSIQWLFELSKPLLSEKGIILTLKGPSFKEELKDKEISFGSFRLKSFEERLPLLNHQRVMVVIERSFL